MRFVKAMLGRYYLQSPKSKSWIIMEYALGDRLFRYSNESMYLVYDDKSIVISEIEVELNIEEFCKHFEFVYKGLGSRYKKIILDMDFLADVTYIHIDMDGKF